MKCQFKYNEAFLVTALRKHRKRGVVQKVFYTFLGLFLAWIVFFAFAKGKYSSGAVPAILLVALIFSSQIDEFILRRKIRKSPFYDSEVKIEFSEDGIHTKQNIAETTLKWEAFTRATEYTDGLLAYQGDSQFNWFPRNSFPDKEAYDSVKDLLKRKILKYKGAEQNIIWKEIKNKPHEPNEAPHPTPVLVTKRAPSSTLRAKHLRG